ncbi:uncharacterized protein LOC105200600 [Solenopsis invicta]|uniref:uncharacterized protein LOC105200600 n=1 Tax=Solenopsis invicta TaxID=13686 RepID=UPI00193DE40D|nr:uncharacterized protein LOC105200600 [Solenopsis invicta]
MEVIPRKKARKEKLNVSKNGGAIQMSENALVSNIHLTYDILRIVFQYLNAGELANAAMVCRLWLQAADDEKKKRGAYCVTLDTFKLGFFDNFLLVDQLSWHINRKAEIKPSIGFFFLDKELLFAQSNVAVSHNTCTFEQKKENAVIYRILKNSLIFTTAVLITGAIQTWSVVLDKTCNTEEQIKKELNLFKAQVKLKKHSIAFMNMLRLKYENMESGNEDNESESENNESENEDSESESEYIKYEIPFKFKEYQILDGIRFSKESQIFSMLFPTIPLVGCLGWDGFGKTTSMDEINEEKKRKTERKCNRFETWYHKSGTVFLIITYD